MGSEKQRSEGKRCGKNQDDPENEQAIGEIRLIRGRYYLWYTSGNDVNCVRFGMTDISVEGSKVGVDWPV